MLEFAVAISVLAVVAGAAAAILFLSKSQAATNETLRKMVHEQGQKLLAKSLAELARHDAAGTPETAILSRDDYTEAQLEKMRWDQEQAQLQRDYNEALQERQEAVGG